jgi:hypothetical protein
MVSEELFVGYDPVYDMIHKEALVFFNLREYSVIGLIKSLW